MKSILSLLPSVFVSIANSQQCGNTHTGSLLLSVSINGRSVDEIGKSTYLSVINQAYDEISQSSGQDVGLNWFGGDEDGDNTGTILTMGDSSSSVIEAISTLNASYDFDIMYGNSVSGAMDEAYDTLSGESGQRYHVIFSAGNPLNGLFGSETKPTNFDDPCSNSITAKNARIQTYVALIGTQGINFVKEYYSCVVEDPTTDIIVIDPDSPSSGISELSALLCKTDGYDVRITEVNPIDGSYKTFIEILNFGADATVKACWDDTSSCSGTATISAGEYFVGYYSSGSGTTPTADETSGSLPSQTTDETSWTALAVIGSTTYDSVTYGSTGTTSNYWQEHISGRSFELRGIGYNNQYGGNWRVSCSPNVEGSPGSDPETCDGTDATCTSDSYCTANGDSSGSCTNTDTYCQCSTGYVEDVDACIDMPAPLTTMDCYIIRDSYFSVNYLYFAVSRVDWDDSVTYYITYPTSGNDVREQTGVSTLAVNDYDAATAAAGNYTITVEAEYEGILSGQKDSVYTTVSCSVYTMAPTSEPTSDPTLQPTTVPTVSPTPEPTYEDPGIYLYSSRFDSPLPRGVCWEESRDCCTPFGPDYGATLTGGSMPSWGNCSHTFYSIQLESTTGDLLEESIKLQLYPTNFDLETEIMYTITAYGVHNSSTLEQVPWLEGNGSSTVNGSNYLNIYMHPPGTGSVSNGSVNVADGSTYTDILFNITSESIGCSSDEECVTYEQCTSNALVFGLELTSCDTSSSDYPSCDPLYPYLTWITVTRSESLCSIIYYGEGNEDELPTWFWPFLIGMLIFMLCLGYLIYRFWWKQKKTATELGDAEDELDQQKADNEAGFGGDIGHGDVVMNPMATGVPGMNRPQDVFGNEIQQRQLNAQNDMVDVQAEVFQVRQDYGQVATGTRNGYQ